MTQVCLRNPFKWSGLGKSNNQGLLDQQALTLQGQRTTGRNQVCSTTSSRKLLHWGKKNDSVKLNQRAMETKLQLFGFPRFTKYILGWAVVGENEEMLPISYSLWWAFSVSVIETQPEVSQGRSLGLEEVCLSAPLPLQSLAPPAMGDVFIIFRWILQIRPPVCSAVCTSFLHLGFFQLMLKRILTLNQWIYGQGIFLTGFLNLPCVLFRCGICAWRHSWIRTATVGEIVTTLIPC